MVRPVMLFVLLVLPFFFVLSREAKTLDPYKVLGVEKSSNQLDIQKAFHKLSLKYHPDKNKNKGAQEKFAEINNAYEILSDEDKRKNYDLYGDAQGGSNTGFDEGNFGNPEGYTYFGSGGPGGEHFASGPGGWQQGNTRSFSFSFGGDSGARGSRSGFDMGDIFSNFFQASGKRNGNHHGGFTYSSSGANSNSDFPPSGSIEDVDSQAFDKKIRDQGMTWFLLFYTPSTKGYNALESVLSDVANSLHGALKAGKINCQTEQALCRDLGVSSTRSGRRLFIHGYGSNGKDYLLEYNGEFDARSLKSFCQDHLPRVSKRVDLSRFEFPSNNKNLPQVLLLSTKKDTPVMWRAISGMFFKRFAFYDAEVHDVSHPFLNKFEVKALPALVGRLSNGDAYVLKQGIAVKDLQSGITELKSLLESFERKNNFVSSQSKKTESQGKNTPLLTASNMGALCGDATPVCFIGVFRSQKAREKLDNILSALSRKTLVRKQNQGLGGHGDSISYSLLDAKKQPQILSSFDRSGFNSLDAFILSYKPRKGKYAAHAGELTMEQVENFVSSVLNGDVIFTEIRQNPAFR